MRVKKPLKTIPVLLFAILSPLSFATSAFAEPHGTNELQGVVRAAQKAEIASGISARIRSLPFLKGQSFNQGDLLISFDCDAKKAEAEALRFGYVALQRKFENARELVANGAAGKLDADIAEAEMRKAQAETKAIKTRLKECEISAPYDGIIVERHVSAFETPALNAPLLTIINAATLEIHFIAPSKQLKDIQKGTNFSFIIDDTSTTHAAQVIRTGAVIDPVSQTVEVIAAFTDASALPLAGMSGIVQLGTPPSQKIAGHE